MEYPKDYIEYLIHFHGDRDYFECHEILEEYWKAQPRREEQWVVLIQIAVGLYHHRRGNRSGARKMLLSAESKITKSLAESLGMNFSQLILRIKERLAVLENGDPYEDMNLPISDTRLLEICQLECIKRDLIWQAPSSKDEQLVHRHTLRDRSSVIQEREESFRKRR